MPPLNHTGQYVVNFTEYAEFNLAISITPQPDCGGKQRPLIGRHEREMA